MNKSLFAKVYDSKDFKKKATNTVELLSNHLNQVIKGEGKAIPWNDAESEYQFWSAYQYSTAEDFFKTICDRSVRTHHKKYLGHQVGPTAPVSALASFVGAFLNNGSAVYEMGMANNAIERIIAEELTKKIGFDSNARGFLTSGGSLGNLTALLSAKAAYLKKHPKAKRLGIIVCEQAHYSIERTARIMNIESEGLVLIPAKNDFTIDCAQLETRFQNAKREGIEIFALIGNAPSTATGKIDDLTALGDFCRKHQLWYHVDAAHGGAAIYSTTFSKDLKGIEQADSVVIDGHKMMMMPAITTALLFKNGSDSYNTFRQKADYLLSHTEEEDWSNMAKRTFECTKNMMALEWYILYQEYSDELFDEYVSLTYNNTRKLADKIQSHDHLELAVYPDTNILCFRYIQDGKTDLELNKLNASIRKQILEEGEFYILQTILNKKTYLRLNSMNPFTDEKDYDMILQKILSLV